MTDRHRTLFLWFLIIIAFLLHQFFSLHNLRFGVNVVKSGFDAVPTMEMVKRLGLYLLPMIYIAGLLFVEGKVVRLLNFIASLIYTAFHTWHFVDELGKMKDWVQWILLTVILAICLLQNRVAWRWYRQSD